MAHPKIKKFQKGLHAMFDEIDDYLEDRYGKLLMLHPNRPPRGSTASKAQDGLFDIGAQFSAGYNSTFGRGYSIDLKIVSLEKISEDLYRKIIDDLIIRINEKLKTYFPERTLWVEEDIRSLKIVGNLSLGDV